MVTEVKKGGTDFNYFLDTPTLNTTKCGTTIPSHYRDTFRLSILDGGLRRFLPTTSASESVSQC